MPDDSWMKGLTALQAMRGGGSESTIQERRDHGFRLNVLVPLGHGLAFTLSVALAFFGVFLLMRSAALDFRGWGAVFLLLGPGLAFGFAMVAVNQARELVDTFWRKSPWEKMTGPASAHLLNSIAESDGDEGMVPRIIPYRLNGGDVQATSGLVVDGVPTDRRDVRLLDFLELAESLHVAPTRRMMGVESKRPYLLRQSRERLTRELYDAILADLVTWGFVRVAGRRGSRATWALDPRRAYAILERELVRRHNAADSASG